MWVEWKDGADLSQSRKKPGDYSPLTRDSEGNLGHVTLSDVDGDDDEQSGWSSERLEEDDPSQLDPVAAVLVEIAVQVLPQLFDLVYTEAKPHVTRWWDGTARPAIRAGRLTAGTKLAAIRSGRGRRQKDQDVSVETRRPVSASNDHGEVEAERPKMSSNEAQQRLVAALIARAFSDRQIELLLGARVDISGEAPEENLLQQIPPEVIERHVSRMLAANTSLHEELLDVFWADETDGGSALPLPIEQIARERTFIETED